MTKPLQSFTIAAVDGNTVSLGQTEADGLLVGVHVKGTAFPAYTRLSRDEAEQLSAVIDILLLTNPVPVASNNVAAAGVEQPEPPAVPAKPAIKTAKKK